MAALNKMETVPGFTLQSENFLVRFITGLQKKQVSKIVENETDWMDVFNIIFRNLEKFPFSLEKFYHILTEDMNSWITTLEGAPDMKISVKILEKVYFAEPYGSKKKLIISL